MKVLASNEKVVVIEPFEKIDQVKNYILTDNGFYYPTVLRIFPDYIEIDTTGFDKHGTMHKKKKKVWIRDMLIMNDALFKINHPREEKK